MVEVTEVDTEVDTAVEEDTAEVTVVGMEEVAGGEHITTEEEEEEVEVVVDGMDSLTDGIPLLHNVIGAGGAILFVL